jgi:hypothetical protein
MWFVYFKPYITEYYLSRDFYHINGHSKAHRMARLQRQVALMF